MADALGNYVFLAWVRQGAAAGIQTPDMSANQAAVVSVNVKLRINDTDDIEHQVRLYGPGDVIGIDPQQVVRTEPRNGATDFEPNYFPAIEFDRPDFPWLFTPGKATDAGTLRPWICLIVVRNDAATLRVDRSLPLPVLEIKSPANELPDLSESWAWAHTQVAGTNLNSVNTALKGDPALNVSRLLCPRRLDPLTDYLACLVPAFELGRRAGLGEQIQPADEQPPLAPAWVFGAQAPTIVKLPVYFRWQFRTGTGGDFESLVRLLKARAMPSTVGIRPVDISDPGFVVQGQPDPAKGTMLGLEGALRAVETKADEWQKEVRLPFQTALQKILNTSWETATIETAQNDPIVGPPVYGCWQAARHTVFVTPPPGVTLNWLDELNLDPRHRAVAALGTQVIQTEQEQLVASAWEQLGEIDRINQMRRQAQFGRTVNAIYHVKHFARFSEETLLKVLAPAQARVVVEPATTTGKRALLVQKIAQSALPANAVAAPLRRFTSPRGVISSRFVASGAAPIAMMAKLTAFTSVTFFQPQQSGLITLNQVSDNQSQQLPVPLKQSVLFDRISRAIDSAPRLADFKIVPEAFEPKRTLLNFKPGPPDSPDADMFRKVAKAQQDYLVKLFLPPKSDPAPPMDTDIKGKLLQSVNPEKTIYARVRASLDLAPGAESSSDLLEPILDAPKFPQPMYEALRDLSQDFLLPGLENVPPNTVALLETNSRFVEAFMVGLNAELNSELLWRDYPTDQRGTFFQQFWDTSAGIAQEDIEPIIKWRDRKLGQNTPNTSGKLVLLIRGELLLRYPNSVIYAVRAVKPKPNAPLDLSPKTDDERHPLFRGTLKPDVTFLGFNLTEDEALGKPPNDANGWFFVIQQQPTEPRFGLDEADFVKPPQPPPLTTWNDLSWRHLVKNEAELKALSHASVKTVLPEIDHVKWGKNSAHQAFITLQRPVRIAIHAKQMIKKA